MPNTTYSFQDVNASLVGIGGSLILSEGGIADEGITVSMSDDKVSQTMGADGTGMFSLHAARNGRITVRLLKTSPLNAALARMYEIQTTSSAYTSSNTFTIVNPIFGDSIVCRECAFMKLPDHVSAKDGGTMEWPFLSNAIHMTFGDGTLQT